MKESIDNATAKNLVAAGRVIAPITGLPHFILHRQKCRTTAVLIEEANINRKEVVMPELLKRTTEIMGYSLGAEDGRIGECHDFLFDDTNWVIRYIVADTRKWLPGRKVLISPIAIGAADSRTHTLPVSLTREQIKESPPIDTDAPVSRQYEILFNRYYSWSHYWDGDLAWGVHPYPRLLQQPNSDQYEFGGDLPEEKSHLRSAGEVIGYQIRATDTDIGHLEDLILEEESWIVRYLLVDTSNWLPGSKRVIVPTALVKGVDWAQSAVALGVEGATLKDGPGYDPDATFDRTFEEKVFDFYNLPSYWQG